MREFRTVYNAPCGTGKHRKPGYVPTRVDVAVCQIPTGTGEAMLHPLPKSSTGVAGLGGVGRFHEFNPEPDGFGLVPHQVLKLAEGPAMQPRPHPLPGLDPGPDMGEILHAEDASPRLEGLRDDGFAGDVVDVADMPLLFARDGLELPLGSPATVGLESAAGGEVAIPVMPELATPKKFAGAECGEVVFPDIQAHGQLARKGDGIREVEHQVQVPNAPAIGEPGFLGHARGQERFLRWTAGSPDLGPARRGEEGECIPPNRVGSVIEVDGSGREVDRGDGLVLGDTLVGSKRFIGVRHPMDGLTDHLTAEGGKRCPNPVIDQVVQRHPVPAAMGLDKRHDRIAGFRKEPRKLHKRLSLLGRSQELEGSGSLHFAIFSSIRMGVKHPFLPALKDGVSWTIR
jgi:hypothetical protein